MSAFARSDGLRRLAGATTALRFGTRSARRPLVSIMIPTYRRPEMLMEAIASATNQVGFDDFEVVVVDNDAETASPTSAELVARAFNPHKVSYYQNARNLGMTGNWNRCIELARGRWYTLLHDDDWLAPRFLQRMMQDVPRDASLLACLVERGTEPYDPKHGFQRAWRLRRRSRVPLSNLAAGTINPAPGILVSTAAATEAGGYADEYYPSADYAFIAKLTRLSPTYLVNERLAYYRTTDSQTFKGDTLERIITMGEAIRRDVVRETGGLKAPFLAFCSSVWWYSFGKVKGLNVEKLYQRRPAVRAIAHIPAATLVLRALASALTKL